MPADLPYLLMTRPHEASEAFVETLPESLRSRLRVVISPLIEIRISETPVQVDPSETLIFSSANGVRAAVAMDVPRGGTAFCVGAATTSRAEEAGWTARFMGKDADALVARLVREAPAGKLCHLHGAHTRGDIVPRLREAGLTVREAVVYDQPTVPLSDEAVRLVASESPMLVPLFSPRTAGAFAAQAVARPGLVPLCLSANVADPLRASGFGAVKTAARPDAESMVALLESELGRLCRVEGGPGAH